MAPSSILFLLLLLHMTGSAEKVQTFSALVGVSVFMPCKNVELDAQEKCDKVTWTFRRSDNTEEMLDNHGKVESKRHFLTNNCSLEIKTVTVEDSGHYICKHISPPGQNLGEDIVYLLSVTGSNGVLSTPTILVDAVKAGDKVALSCGSVKAEKNTCNDTTWLFSAPGSKNTVTQFERGGIHRDATSKSGRLNVAGNNCSLLITKVTVSDAGRYICRRFKSGKQEGGDVQTDLSVVSMSKHDDDKGVMLNCSVSPHSVCHHTVKWLFNKKEIKELKPWQISASSACDSSVTLPLTSLHSEKPNHHLFSCNVTDTKNKRQFTFDLQLTPDKSGDENKIPVTQPNKNIKTDTTTSQPPNPLTRAEDWWWLYIIVALAVVVVAAALLVFVVRFKRTKETKTQKSVDDANPEEDIAYASINYTKKNSNNAQADPEEGVAYASVSYTKKNSNNGRVLRKHEDDDEAENVTYTTVMQLSTS